MKKSLLFSALLFTNIYSQAQNFELRLNNAGNGQIAVEMRETSGKPPQTSDIQTDLVFGICWDAGYGIDLGEITSDYTIRKAGPETVLNGLEFQQFAKDPTPRNFSTNWESNQWVTLMKIPNNRASSQAKGSFSVCPTAIQELNINYNLVDYPVTAAGNATGVQIGQALPKGLKMFSASLNINRKVDLLWELLSDSDFLRFELEHSTDGSVFNTFATVPARESDPAAENRYTGMHEPLQGGAHYYRLKMTGRNGQTEYAPVRIIQLERQADWSVTPNPTKGDFILTLEADYEAEVQLSVVDASGKTIYQDFIAILQGVNSKTVRLPAVSSGMHQVSIRWSDGAVQTKNLVVQE